MEPLDDAPQPVPIGAKIACHLLPYQVVVAVLVAAHGTDLRPEIQVALDLLQLIERSQVHCLFPFRLTRRDAPHRIRETPLRRSARAFHVFAGPSSVNIRPLFQKARKPPTKISRAAPATSSQALETGCRGGHRFPQSAGSHRARPIGIGPRANEPNRSSA